MPTLLRDAAESMERMLGGESATRIS